LNLFSKFRDIDAKPKPVNPLTEEFLRKKPNTASGGLVRGGLASSSIFEDEEVAGPKPSQPREKRVLARNPDTMAAVLDPDPEGRRRWERKMVIREIHKRGRLTRAQALKRKERVLLSKSHDFETSVKKLVPLAKQIAGKTVEDAIIQMRFSKNEAIVRRGMGLGLGGKEFTPIQIKTKDGKRVKVQDPTTLYVDQAWCGKGIFGTTPDYRARGNINLMKNRTTSRLCPTI
jgi:ribosomal protein L22